MKPQIDTASARFEPQTVAGVIFDIGGVFLYPQYKPVLHWLDTNAADHRTEPSDFRRAHHAGVRALSLARLAPDEHDPDFWAIYDAAYLASIGIDPELAHQVAPAMRNRWDWRHDQNISAFHKLATGELPLAIVSNNDGTAQDQMINFGVCQVGNGPLPEVAIVVDSTVEGIAKPDPAIFDPAIEALGIDPENLLYVGDTVHADVLGATAAGLQVIQLDPFDQHADFAHSRCHDLDTLIGLLSFRRGT